MKSRNDGKRKIPKDIWFAIFFAGSFLPNIFGKVSAVFAGAVLSVFLLGFFKGKKRFVLAIVLPVVACLVVRLLSNWVYKGVVNVQFRGEIFSWMDSVWTMIVHYLRRLEEGILSLRGFVLFFQTWEFSELAPVWRDIQFVLMLPVMIYCLVVSVQKRAS